jgi:hypothetical protein
MWLLRKDRTQLQPLLYWVAWITSSAHGSLRFMKENLASSSLHIPQCDDDYFSVFLMQQRQSDKHSHSLHFNIDS